MPNHLKIPTVALNLMLQSIVDKYFTNSIGATLKARLFISNHTPVDADVLATYTAIEASFNGYASTTIGSWTAAVLVGTKSLTTAPLITWTAGGSISGPQTCYGYFITDFGAPAKLIWAQLFDTPVTVTNPGDVVILLPSFAFSSQY